MCPRRQAVTLASLLTLLILAACTQPGAVNVPVANLTPEDPTTYVHVVYSDPTTLDPALNYETAGAEVILNTHNSLIFFDKTDPNSFVPELATEVPSAENGGISADGLTYTFHIRTGVQFHNGDEMTPDDVAYTFQRGLLQGGSFSPQWLLAEPLLGVIDVAQLVDESGELIDDPASLAASAAAGLQAACQSVMDAVVADPAAGTVTFHLAKPWSPFLATLAQSWGSITQKQWIVENGGWDGDCETWQTYYGRTVEEINQTAIGSGENGTGPFILERWTPGQEYVLKANENYWRTEPAWEGGPVGPPALKTVVVRNVGEFSTRYAMLQAGDADSILPGSPADWLQLDALAGEICDAAGNCQPSETPGRAVRVYRGLPTVTRDDVFMNWNVNIEGGNNFVGSGQLDGNGIPPDFFANLHIRKAFNYCFDWDVYIGDVQQGAGVQSYNAMQPGMIGYDENSPHYRYDPDQCRAEFDAAAEELQAQYGVDFREVGFRFTAAYETGNTLRQTVAEILQQNVNLVNEKFVVEVTGLPWPNILQNLQARKLPIFVSGWLEDIHDPHNWVVPYTVGYFGSTQGLPPDLQAQFQDIIARGVAETDLNRRQAIYQEFNQLYYEQAPTILLSVPLERRYAQRWVQGWFHNPILLPKVYFYSMSKQ